MREKREKRRTCIGEERTINERGLIMFNNFKKNICHIIPNTGLPCTFYIL
jgi:hypothetical protein